MEYLTLLTMAISFLTSSLAYEEGDKDKFQSSVLEYVKEMQYLLPDDELPVILYWYSDNFGWPDNRTINCKLGSCVVSKSRSIVHSDRTRMILFYGTSILNYDLPLPRTDKQLWALIHEESPKNNWFLSHDAGIRQFNYTSTFRRESDYPATTGWIKDPYLWLKPKNFVPTKEKNRLQRELDYAPLVYVQSGCHTSSDRSAYIRELMKHIPVDSYGRCLNNKKMPPEHDGFVKLRTDGFYKFMAQYKFHLAFENAICQDYMTEKLFRPLDVGSVPVYRGSPRAREYMPTNKSIIMVNDFDGPKELAEYIKRLNDDDEEYDSYLNHMKNGISNDFLLQSVHKRYVISKPENYAYYSLFSEYECFLCDKMYERNEKIKQHVKDPSQHPLPAPKFANSSHLGCPQPSPSFIGSPGKRTTYSEGYYEGLALEQMLLSKETNSSRYVDDYLKRVTDKYPKRR